MTRAKLFLLFELRQSVTVNHFHSDPLERNNGCVERERGYDALHRANRVSVRVVVCGYGRGRGCGSDLSNLDAQYDAVILMPVPNTTPAKMKSYAAGTVIQAQVTNQSGGATNTLHLFGFLYAA